MPAIRVPPPGWMPPLVLLLLRRTAPLGRPLALTMRRPGPGILHRTTVRTLISVWLPAMICSSPVVSLTRMAPGWVVSSHDWGMEDYNRGFQ
jgi:hypothetical protein